jgi:hypothetical protein
MTKRTIKLLIATGGATLVALAVFLVGDRIFIKDECQMIAKSSVETLGHVKQVTFLSGSGNAAKTVASFDTANALEVTVNFLDGSTPRAEKIRAGYPDKTDLKKLYDLTKFGQFFIRYETHNPSMVRPSFEFDQEGRAKKLCEYRG